MRWTYEKLDENGKVKYCPANDPDGKITGKIVMGLRAYFDENPEERIRLGWIKHIHYDREEIEEKIKYNRQTQHLIVSQRNIDAYTVEDVFHAIDKSEEMLLFETMAGLYWGEGMTTTFAVDGDQVIQI